MINLFNDNRAGVLLFIPVIVLFYGYMNTHFDYYVIEESLNFGIWGEVKQVNTYGTKIVSGSIVVFNAIAINWIYNTNQFLERNSYLLALLYCVFYSFFQSFYHVDGILLAQTSLLIAVYQFYQLRQNEDGRSHVFNGAFFSGLAATFHPPMITILPVVWFMIWTIRPFVFRETLLSLAGFLVPLAYAFVFLMYSGHKIDLQILNQSANYINKSNDFGVVITLFVMIFLLSLVAIRRRTQKASIRLKKLISILWWFAFIGAAFGIIDFIFFKQFERFSFLMIPLAVFFTFAFSQKSFSAVGSILFYLTLVYSLIKFLI